MKTIFVFCLLSGTAAIVVVVVVLLTVPFVVVLGVDVVVVALYEMRPWRQFC